jgi:hypothetical protein
MFHTFAFQSSISNDGNLHQTTYVPDSILPPAGNGLLSNALAYLMALAVVGTNATRGQFQAPSLRDYGNIDIDPVNIGTVFENPPRLNDYSQKMIPLAAAEEWDGFTAQNNGSTSETETLLGWCSDNTIQPVPPKKIVQIYWTASTTLVSGKWSLIAMTLSQPLYSGSYALVGARLKSAGAVAFRFVPSGGISATTNRPGGIGVQADDQLDWPRQRFGGWGTWLQFTNTTVPQIEVLSLSNDTSESGIIDIVPL